MVLQTWQGLPENEEMTDTVGALLVNMEAVHEATWIPSIFLMAAKEISWSQEEISVGEQSQAALIQEQEADTASACMYH